MHLSVRRLRRRVIFVDSRARRPRCLRVGGRPIFRSPAEDEGDDYYPPGKLKLIDTTITGNRANSDDVGSGFGGGVMSGSPGLVRIGGTISGNLGTGGAPDDCTCFR